MKRSVPSLHILNSGYRCALRMAKPSKERLIFGIYLLLLIIIIDLVLHQFHLPNWPAFFVMIFFFEAHMDVKKAPHIIIGGLIGIVCVVLTALFVKEFAPYIGNTTATLTFVCIAVYAIVAFGEILPVFFNNYAFMSFLISGLASNIADPSQNPWLWMGVDLVAGTLVVLSILGIRKLTALTLSPRA
jgi:hypothetical protein